MRGLSQQDQIFLTRIASLYHNAGRGRGLETEAKLMFELSDLCHMCTAPTDGSYECYPCGKQHKEGPYGSLLPDIYAPLFYAIPGEQSGRDVYEYKRAQSVQAPLDRIKIAVYFFFRRHLECLAAEAGVSPSHVMAVPSGRGRRDHPLDTVFLPFLETLLEVRRVARTAPPRPGNTRQKEIDPELFEVGTFDDGDHVVVIDDTWTTGANILSLAVAARRSGAGTVSVIPFARYLSKDFRVTKSWLDANSPLPPFDPRFCPVTRSHECP